MASADTSIYNLLRPQKTAFDNFLRGQEAKQNYEQNQQMMQARQQQMQQAAAMNPLLLQSAQQGIDLNEALNPEKIEQARNINREGERAYQQQLKLDPIAVDQAQAGVDLTTQQTATSATADKYNQFQLRRGEKLLPGEVSGQSQDAELQRLRMLESKANTKATRAKAGYELAKYQNDKRAMEIQQRRLITSGLGSAAKQYMEIASQSPEAAEQMKPMLAEVYKSYTGLDLPIEDITPGNMKKAIYQKEVMDKMIPKSIEIQELEIKKAEALQKGDVREAKSIGKKAEGKGKLLMNELAINDVEKLLNFDLDVWEDMTGSIEGRLPAVQQDETDFGVILDGLKSKLTVENLDKMQGPLTDTDIAILRQAAGNLHRAQSEPQLRKEVEEIKRILFKNRDLVSERYNIDNTVPDTPDYEGTPEENQAIINKYLE